MGRLGLEAKTSYVKAKCASQLDCEHDCERNKDARLLEPTTEGRAVGSMAHGDGRQRRKRVKQRASTLQDNSGRAENCLRVVAQAAEQRHEQGL